MNSASFLTRCACGALVKLFELYETYPCPVCDRDLTVLVNHTQASTDIESFRDWASRR